jgi:hypothetical protein
MRRGTHITRRPTPSSDASAATAPQQRSGVARGATITTLGFGDVAPTSSLVRAITAVEVVSGLLMLLFGFGEITRSASEGAPTGRDVAT